VTDRVLGVRALNRALLHRQSLLRRRTVSVTEMVRRLVGLQAQAPNPPYFGLWSRIEGFRPEQAARLLTDRTLVRIVLMRGTIHLVTADDCRLLRPVLQPALERMFRGSASGGGLVGLDPADLAAEGRALLAGEPLSPKELGSAMAARWPDHAPGDLANGVRTCVPLVQVPPRGVWGASGLARHTTAESWLGTALDGPPLVEYVVRRYLAAFGPASVADVQRWSGLSRLGEVVDRMRPGLLVLRDEHGGELLDLPGARRPDPDTPAPVRLVAPFDNLVLSHVDRTRILPQEHKKRLFSAVNGIIPGSVLVDGFVVGRWRLARTRDRATLHVEQFAPLSAADRAAVTEEGGRLLAFAEPDAHEVDVRFDA
jgi:Winged helix DNA-binding domain